MSDLREKYAEAIYAGGDEPEWITTVDGSPNSAAYEHADRVLAVRDAEVAEKDAEIAKWRRMAFGCESAFTTAEAEIRVLRARLAALADEWDREYTTSNGVDSYMRAAAYKVRALASVPEPSEPAAGDEEVADGVVWQYVDGEWREKPCPTCAGSGDAPSAVGVVTDCFDCDGTGFAFEPAADGGAGGQQTAGER